MSGLGLKPLYQKYIEEYSLGTPFVVACELGRVKDVNAMIRGATRIVNKLGKDSIGKIKTNGSCTAWT